MGGDGTNALIRGLPERDAQLASYKHGMSERQQSYLELLRLLLVYFP